MTRRARITLAGVTLAVIVVVSAALTLVGPDVRRYRVPSEAMAPTLAVGSQVDVNRDAYHSDPPRRGDIVVFHPPAGSESGTCGRPLPVDAKGEPSGACATPTPGASDARFLQRVVALPGDRVAIRKGRVVLNGRPQAEPYVRACGAAGLGCDLPRPVTVPPRHVFVLGDNREAADDSRFWGPVALSQIEGRVDDCAALQLSCSARRRT